MSRSSSSQKAAVEGRSIERSSSSYEYESTREMGVESACMCVVSGYWVGSFLWGVHIILSIIGTEKKTYQKKLWGRAEACVVVLQRVCCHPRGGGSACFVASLSPVPTPLERRRRRTRRTTMTTTKKKRDDEDDNQTEEILRILVFICIRDYY